jgi:hypothetical protein
MLARQHADRYFVVDGTKAPDLIHKQIVHAFRERYPAKKPAPAGSKA